MRDTGRRPQGRLCYWVLVMMAAFGLEHPKVTAAPVPQSGPATTTVTDTVYQANGSPAQGNLIISWPAFMTAGGAQVASGSTNVALAANGTFTVALVPNAGATPAGVYYTTVYQIGPGEVKTEYWVVPTTSPANLATVRMTPGSGVAGPAVSMQYVNSALAAKANDSAVVHLSGAETISGTKTFATSPNVPAPANSGDVATKGYVDQSVTNVGAGTYLSIAGGTMTGAITLPANPVSAMHASTKGYVDTGMAEKADLVSGVVPTNELGTGTAGAGTCLQGNGSWGPCGTGTGNLSTTPVASQAIAQPVGTQFSANNLANIRYVTASWNWSQYFSSGTLTANTPATVTLTPCPLGINTAAIANIPYYIALASGNNSVTYQAAESDMVTGGSCTPGAASGTVTFTPQHSYTSGFTVGSATAGIQEAINDGCGVTNTSSSAWANRQCRIVLPPSGGFNNSSTYQARNFNVSANYNIYAPIIFQAQSGKLEGDGAVLNCYWRNYCLQIGDRLNSNAASSNTVSGLSFRTPWNTSTGQYGIYGYGFTGCNITQTQRTSQAVTLTTSGCGVTFQPGDMITVMFTDNTLYWGDAIVTAVGVNTISYAHPGADLAAQTTPGVVALAFGAIYDNGQSTRFMDITYDSVNEVGHFNTFFDFQDDEDAVVEKFNNNGINLQTSATWSGSFFQSLGNLGVASPPPTAAVVTVSGSSITANGSSCFTFLNSNGLYIDKTVCQAQGLWEVNVSNINGNYQGADIQNLYSEASAGENSISPVYTPFAGTGSAGEMISKPAASGTYGIRGNGGVGGAMPSGGTGSNPLDYFVIVNDVTAGTHSNPLYAYHWGSTCGPSTTGSGCATGSPDNPVIYWPRVANGTDVITYTLLRVSGGVNANGQAVPYAGNCGGGSAAACGSVVVAQAQQTGLVQSFTDSSSGMTSVFTFSPALFAPSAFNFWPGPLTVDASGAGSTPNPIVITDQDVPVTTFVTTGPAETARACPNLGFSYGGYIQCPWSLTSNNVFNQTALMLADGAMTVGTTAGVKGRLNFTANSQASVTGHHIITLVDSNPAKTQATNGMRPGADAADTYIGLDNPTAAQFSQAQLAFGSPVSISEYIGNVGNNTSFLERLTASTKTFNVPVTVNGNLAVTSGSVTLPVTGSGFQCLHVSSAGVVSGTGADCGSGGSGTVNPGSTAQLAMYSGMGAAVSGDSSLTDNGTTLNYTGSGGIAAASAAVSGNITVNGQLQVAGPWEVSSPIPGTSMPPASAGTSALGISNDGNFYISTNGGTPVKVATSASSSYFPNLWQEDTNDLGAYNGTNPQGFHVYGTYGGASNFERTGLGWDGTDNYFVLRNENQGTGQQRGIGFWIGSGIRWGINTASELKPFANNSYNIGDANFAPQTIYAGTSFDTLTKGALNFELCNGAAGTALNFLAKYDASGCAVKSGVSDTDGLIGIVSGGSGTSGNAVITYQGYAQCSFDGTPALGDYVVVSTTNPGDCHDAGAGRPTGVQVLARVESLSPGSGTYGVRISLNAPGGTGALPAGTIGEPLSNVNGSTAYAAVPLYEDVSQEAGATLDVKLNNANARAITSGNSTIDTRALGGTQTIASEVSIGELRPPVLTGGNGGSLAYGTYKGTYTLTSPGATETSASMEANLTLSSANCTTSGSCSIVFSSPTYYGTATSFNPYLTAASGASWSETKCTAQANTAISSNATVTAACGGSAVSKSNKGFAVTLIPPHVGQWQVTIADTVANTSCGLRFFDQSSYLGDSAGEGRPFQVVSASSSTNVEALICTDNNPKYSGSYYNLNGLSAANVSGDQVQSAVIVLENVYDVSRFENVEAVTWTAIPALWARQNLCCGDRISGNMEANGVGEPLKIGLVGSPIHGLDLNSISAVHPATTLPNIELVGSMSDIHFTGMTYTEGNSTNTCSDAVQMATGSNINGPVTFDDFDQGAYCTGTSSYLFSVPSTYTVGNFTVHATDTGHYTNLFKYTPSTALNVSGVGTNLTYPELAMDNNNSRTVLTNFAVNGTTALATATATTVANADSSTNVATTAFVKNQGYVPNTTTVNGHALSSNVTVSASDINTGALPHAQLPALMSGDIPNNAANTTGTAANLSGTPTLPNGTLATTQTAGDNSPKLATTAYVRNEEFLTYSCPVATVGTVEQFCTWTLPAAITVTGFDLSAGTAPASCSTYPTVQVWDGTANAEVGSFSISMSNGSNFYPQVTGNSNVASGHALRIKTTTGQVGCSTNGANVVATVTYQMQN